MKTEKRIPLSGVYFKGKEKEYLNKIMDSEMISMGFYTEKFEEFLKKKVGRKYCVMVSSGTSALFLLLKASGIKENDEIITSPFSFIASANSILYCNAYPSFVDIQPDTLCLSENLLKEKLKKDYIYRDKRFINKKTKRVLKGILTVDILGNLCNYEKIENLCKEYDLLLFEDSSEALGSKIDGKKAGSFGLGSVFAFYPNKQITTGEGGAVLTDDRKLFLMIKSLRNQGRTETDKYFIHRYLGYNFRVTDLVSAIGLAQMENLDLILKKRKEVAQRYFKLLENVKEIRLPSLFNNIENSWFLFYIFINKKVRDRFILYLNERNISSRRYFYPIHLQPFYKKMFSYKKGDFPITEKISEELVAIPFYTGMNFKEQEYVSENIKEFFSTNIL